jgi:solute:Na+ symporter, SSS family
VLASRARNETRRDYFLGGDKLPWWMVGGSIVAANLSSHHFIGLMGVAYDRGFASITIIWGAILIGANALLWIFLPFYLRNGFYTTPEFLQRRFGAGARMLFAVLILITYIFVEIAAVIYMGALALHGLLGISIHASIPVIAVVTGIYTVAGGLRAVVWTEMVQLTVLIAGGIALAFAAVNAGGGWSAFLATSGSWDAIRPASDPDFPWTMVLGGLLCVSIFYWAANQFMVQRVLAAKNEWHGRMGVVLTDYLYLLLPFIIIVPGMIGAQLFPGLEKPDMIFPTLVAKLLPPGVVGLVLAGLVAAVMSHLSGAVNSAMTILTIDFFQVLRPKATEVAAVRFGRWSGVGLFLLGIVMAEILTRHSGKPIFIFLLNAYGYVTPGMAAMFLVGIFWRRATQAGAITAGVLTLVLSVGFELIFPTMPFFNRTGIVFWICVAACIGVSLFTRAPKPEQLKGLIWDREGLRLPEAQRAQSRGWRSPALWWAIPTAIVTYFYIRYA